MAVAKLPIYLVPEGFSHLSGNIVEVNDVDEQPFENGD